MTENNEETNNLLKGILLALTLKEDTRENQAKILKAGGLSKTEIVDLLGPSETTLRTRKHKAKQQQKKQKGFLSKLVSGKKK